VQPISPHARQIAAARANLAEQRKQLRAIQLEGRQQRNAKIHENEERLGRLMAAICSGCGEKPAAGTKAKRAPL
jgi:hypothetical protein